MKLEVLSKILCLASVIVGFGIPYRALAVPINGGFETGDFSGWSTIGHASIQTAALGTGPIEGTFQALVLNAPEGGGFGVSVSGIEAFLGLPTDAIAASFPTSHDIIRGGTALRQTITVQAGDVLTFDVNILTSEPSLSDPFFATLGSNIVSLPVSSFLESNTTFAVETGFRLFTFPPFDVGGDVTLGFGALNALDTLGATALLIDDVRVGTQLPEPSAFFLVAVGVILLLGVMDRNFNALTPVRGKLEEEELTEKWKSEP